MSRVLEFEGSIDFVDVGAMSTAMHRYLLKGSLIGLGGFT
jgi:hypothetical protein